MLILGINSAAFHDSSVCLFDDYQMLSAVSLERLTRRKNDGGRFPDEAITECLEAAGCTRNDVEVVTLARGLFPARYYQNLSIKSRLRALSKMIRFGNENVDMEVECILSKTADSLSKFNAQRFLGETRLPAKARVAFLNHHLSHALPTLFYTKWQDALLYTADGGGDNAFYSAHHFHEGRLTTLFGSDREISSPIVNVGSLGLAYGHATESLGFIVNRHEGKVTGLAARGRPVLFEELAAHFRVTEEGHILFDFADSDVMRRYILEQVQGTAREDVACSIQLLLEEMILKAIRRLLALHPTRHLGLSGGVFANVRLNQRLAEELPVDDIFIYPAMGDDGIVCGGVLQFLLERDGIECWLEKRHLLKTLYYGRRFGAAMDRYFSADAAFRKFSSAPVAAAAELLDQGKVVAIYTEASEFGPRALGARSILADPRNKALNDSLNCRLSRSEFMPFAPVVSVENACVIFDLKPSMLYAARFMTITCRVRDEWRDKIPAVVHVDATARPQVLRREENPLYYDILAAFHARTGVPVLINTSFNAHEEPIINTPTECACSLLDGRVDFVVTEHGVYGTTKMYTEGAVSAGT